MSDLHTRLLLHGESLEDSSPFGIPISNHGVQVSTNQSKFGSKSLYFNGSAYATFPRDTIIYGSGDFTIDWWERPEAGAEARYSNNLGTSAADRYGGLAFGMQGSTLSVGQEPVSWAIDAKNALDVAPGSWTHWAVIRHGNNIATYKNGKKYFSSAFSGSIYYPQGPQVIGRQGNFVSTPHSYRGYIDEFRISDVARWTNNFVPPSEPYPSDLPTKNSVLVSGTIREIYTGKAMLSGAVRSIQKSNVFINGTVHEISLVENVSVTVTNFEDLGEGSYLKSDDGIKIVSSGIFEVPKGSNISMHINSKPNCPLNELKVNGELVLSVFKKPIDYNIVASNNFEVKVQLAGKKSTTRILI